MADTRALLVQLDWFRAQANNPDNSPDDRALWATLAEELERWLAPTPGEQDALW